MPILATPDIFAGQVFVAHREIRLDGDKIAVDVEAFAEVLREFDKMLEEITRRSGLVRFILKRES